MWHRFKQEKKFCGLDIGAHTVKAALMSCEGDVPELLGVYENKTRGFDCGSVSDIAELTDCVHEAVGSLLTKTGARLQEVYLGVGGNSVQKKFSHAVIPLQDRGSKIISSRDIHLVQRQARLLGAAIDEAILHEFPQYYQVDDANRAINPEGLYGRKLEVRMMLLTSNTTVLKNLAKAVQQAGYDVPQIFFSSLTNAQATLSVEQRKSGTLFLDVGAQVTDILLFKDGQLQFHDAIPLGGDHITRRVAQTLGLPLELAENIKQSYANAVEDANTDEEILIKREEGYLPVAKAKIAEAVQEEVSVWVDSLVASVCRAQVPEKLKGGIVMSGGGALLPGLPERMESVTLRPVSLGTVNASARKMIYAPKFASAVGLAHAGWRANKKKSVSRLSSDNLASEIVGRFKELYQEYF